mmetsp:Transcript_17889/g.42584  ORF Transcript_17889/g.42584 Transcript_17889/m.42584 type:complete len:170 (+) Transcript_17889:89-598(+)
MCNADYTRAESLRPHVVSSSKTCPDAVALICAHARSICAASVAIHRNMRQTSAAQPTAAPNPTGPNPTARARPSSTSVPPGRKPTRATSPRQARMSPRVAVHERSVTASPHAAAWRNGWQPRAATARAPGSRESLPRERELREMERDNNETLALLLDLQVADSDEDIEY